FKQSNPFMPVEKLLCWSTLKMETKNLISTPVAPYLDFRTGRLPPGKVLEVRCLRIDAPDWRYELGHGWPAGVSLFVGEQRVLLKKPDDDKFE
ncbi:unnamed protein product, partial [Polarella glacialis]